VTDTAVPKPDHILAAAATRHYDAGLTTREFTARHLGSYTRRPPAHLHDHRPGPDPGGRASARPEVASTVFSQLFNGADPESRASARLELEVGSTSAFSFNPPAAPTPLVSAPGTPAFIFGATEAASAGAARPASTSRSPATFPTIQYRRALRGRPTRPDGAPRRTPCTRLRSDSDGLARTPARAWSP
jgi:hypothetical protein